MKKISIAALFAIALCLFLFNSSCTRKTGSSSPRYDAAFNSGYGAGRSAGYDSGYAEGYGAGQGQQRATEAVPEGFSPVISVQVPYKMTFAGEAVDLSRYDRHERFDRELNGFTYLHSTTMLLVKRANRYFPIIVPILKQNGIPEDFKYLCVIESNLDPRAVSSARAAGLWQFLESTAKEYGLEVTDEVDERYHVEKATRAACAYLHDAYRKCGSWAGAALAYNGGQGRITGQLTQQLASDALDLWLVEETSRYYYRVLAIKQLMENPRAYGFHIAADQLYKPLECKEVNVSQTIDDLAAFARSHGVTYAQLKDMNHWLRSTKLTIKPASGRNSSSGRGGSATSQEPAKEYMIKIPTNDFLYYKEGEPVEVYDRRWVEP